MPIARVLLLPFSWLYGLITGIRNFLYDVGIFTSYSSEAAVICVGNLNVGGTGKSPMIEYLARLLVGHWEVAILSRGYKRKTSGFRMASDSDDASTLGDEPFQFYKKLHHKVVVAVCANRVEGIQKILTSRPSVKVILLDDAFQHRRVKPLFSVLLTELVNPFYNDFILPAGRLRESRRGAFRSDVIVMTKCNTLSADLKTQVERSLSLYKKPVFFSGIRYKDPLSFASGKIAHEIILVTGIANPKPMLDYLKSKFKVIKHFGFTDHHDFQREDLETIQRESAHSILTTEKDFVRLSSGGNSSLLNHDRWFYLPIETEFINNGSEFDTMLLQTIQNHLKRKGG